MGPIAGTKGPQIILRGMTRSPGWPCSRRRSYLARCTPAGLVRALRTDPDTGRGAFWLAAPAIGLHLAAHALGWARLDGPDLHFVAALSLVALGMAALGTLAAATQRMAALGVIIYPLAAALVLLYAWAGHGRAQALDWRLQLHAWLALLAYATLSLSALVAILVLGCRTARCAAATCTPGCAHCRRWCSSRHCCSARCGPASCC